MLSRMAKHSPEIDHLFMALSDPTRRAVVARLARGQASVGELAAGHEMALPTFMAHLAKLERAGLIRTEKAGRVRRCALVPGAFAPAASWLDEQRQLWEARLDRFDDYVMRQVEETRDEP
jgi:DNA-binding transcriptional ArsR family regulator